MMSSHKSTFVLKNSKDSIAKDVGWGEMVVTLKVKVLLSKAARTHALRNWHPHK
jgi:hypothetical protein